MRRAEECGKVVVGLTEKTGRESSVRRGSDRQHRQLILSPFARVFIIRPREEQEREVIRAAAGQLKHTTVLIGSDHDMQHGV